MKVRDKITQNFTILTSLLLISVFILIYFFAQKYTHNEFYLRLSQRATIASQFLFEEDALNANIYNEIRLKHLQILPEEEEKVLAVDVINKVVLEENDLNLPSTFYEVAIERGFARYHYHPNEVFYYGLLRKYKGNHYLIVLSAKDIYGEAKLTNLRKTLAICFLIGILLTYLFGRYYASKVINPITEMIREVNKITATNLHMRLEDNDNKDEMGQLASTFNNMLDRLETSFDLQSNFISSASHEFKNPLTAILGEIEITLNRERSGEEYRNSLIKVEKEAIRLDILVNGLLKLAQTEFDDKGLVIEEVRIDELVIGVQRDFDNIHPESKIIFDFSELPSNPEDLVVQGNKSLLGVAFNNILDNAAKFSMNKDVSVKITARDHNVVVIITDQGVGIPPDELKNIFEPFFRASNVRGVKGFGVGLPLTYRIVKLHSGQLNITSEVDFGTRVEVVLPHRDEHIIVRK
ncbi:sensor histidine kinase [Zhouia amylolytica]|uniref:sensor histidine kinase n=1 Tax=Zhouia amylolytica TaxID=376730 RepID=UPI0020CBEB6C|nr:HAMP domain-containing sensor histidine kinase [Zhouia amylolytica]MCQ0110193.1 HAMP domain-containing histidine kinase [Zhouia amylolytica]